MLSPLQRRVIVRRFGLEGARQRTAPEIARIEGLSVLEVRCLEALALDNLRSKLATCQSPPERF
jgi:DNA-directed RNA polymerase sigma subunit (sigma70/sigma32)